SGGSRHSVRSGTRRSRQQRGEASGISGRNRVCWGSGIGYIGEERVTGFAFPIPDPRYTRYTRSRDRPRRTAPGDLRVPGRRHAAADLRRLPRGERGGGSGGVRPCPGRGGTAAGLGAVRRLLPAPPEGGVRRRAVRRAPAGVPGRLAGGVGGPRVPPRAGVVCAGPLAARLAPGRPPALRAGTGRRVVPEPAGHSGRLAAVRSRRLGSPAAGGSPRRGEPERAAAGAARDPPPDRTHPRLTPPPQAPPD